MWHRLSVPQLATLARNFYVPLILSCSCLAAPKYQVLHAFGGEGDGGGLWASVAMDKKGNLYGTTSGGGAYGYGSVFKLKHQPGGEWTQKVLHSFQLNDPDGDEPFSSGVIFDAAGRLYGTTTSGGAYHHGTVFQMTLGPDGWDLSVLYSFCAEPQCSDGGVPWGPLALDSDRDIFGTAFTAYELSPGPDGWTETVLHEFCQQCQDGYQPFSGVILDARGNLYGTTEAGGAHGEGIVFKLKRMPDGTWREHVLHDFPSFSGDGAVPGLGHLVLDSAGNLYGTTFAGGTHRCGNATCGTVFRLTPKPNGHWKETILHEFRKISTGYGATGGVTLDQAGNLYGTTIGGGNQCDCGVIYKLSPNPDGSWTYNVLHNFSGGDGAQPETNLVLDDEGNLYGTAATGGPGGAGVVFELTP